MKIFTFEIDVSEMNSNNYSVHNCFMCHYVTDSESKLTKHINRYHRHDPSFRASCKGCQYQSISWIAWRKHRTRCDWKEVDNINDDFAYSGDDFQSDPT